MTRATRFVGAALLVAQLSCGAASYQPRPGPRIASLHVNGRVYARDGQRFETGLLGGNAEALVAGNETATTLARKHRRKQIAAWSLYGLGIGGLITASALFWTADENNRAPGIAVGWVSLLPLVASLALVVSANHDLVNAVNIYNDALEGPIAPDPFDNTPSPGGR